MRAAILFAVLVTLTFGRSPATAADPAMSNEQLAAKAARLQSLVETKMVQAHGMVPMFVRASDYKLPTAKDYEGAYRHRHLMGKSEAELGMLPMHIWRAWEDTPSNTAFYLAAMAYQYRVTGDPKVLAICRRTFAGLKYIYNLPIAKGERGFLPKPYGGEYSNQGSGDQLQCFTWGLSAYRAIAPPEDLADINTMMKDFADFQMKTGYVSPHGYFGRNADELRQEWKEDWGRAIIYLPTLYFAWQGTGDAKYVTEIKRWHDAGVETKKDLTASTDKFSTSGFGGKRNFYLTALLMELDPSRHELWRGSMLSQFEQGRTGLRPDGTWPTFWAYDSKTKKVKPEAKQGFSLARTGRSAFFAVGCVTAQRWSPKVNMISDARGILEKLDEATFRFLLPLDDKTPLPAEWQVESKMLDGDSLTAWLCAYWEGRYRGYW